MTTYDFIASNKRKTALIMAVFGVFVLAIGYAVDRYYRTGGAAIMIAAAWSVASGLASYFTGDKVALLVAGARPVDGASNPYLHRMVENLCISTGLPLPKVYVIDDPAINAFATGRDPEHASVAVTTGALSRLENEELEGVLAHELSHIRNYDIRLMTVVIVLVGTITLLADLIFRMSWHGRAGRRRDSDGAGNLILIIGVVLMIFAPFIAQLIQLAVSRRREFLADASGALMTRFPEGLARALRKIAADHRPMARASAATAHLFIASPFAGKALASIFSTHPPIEERIAALEKMAGSKV